MTLNFGCRWSLEVHSLTDPGKEGYFLVKIKSIFFEGAGRGGKLFFTEVSTDYREIPDKIHGRY